MIHFLDWQCILRLLALLLRFDGLMNMDKINNDYLNDIYMDDTMANIEEFYILGVPIKTKIGILYPIYMSHYWIIDKYIYVLALEKEDVLAHLGNLSKINEDFDILFDCAKAIGLYELVCSFKSNEYEGFFLNDLYKQYKELFEFCFREDVFDKIQNSEELEHYIGIIKGLNDIKYNKPNPNPEIAKFDMLERQLQEAKGEIVTFEAMYTSNLITSGVHPNKMTVYQFNKAFDRLGQFKNYETTTLFKTVDVENKIDIELWYSEIKKKEPNIITGEQLEYASRLRDTGGLQEEL